MEIDPSHIPENRYNPVLDSDFVHVDDIINSESGYLNGFPVRYITIDRQAVAARNVGEIHRSITLRREREERARVATEGLSLRLAAAV